MKADRLTGIAFLLVSIAFRITVTGWDELDLDASIFESMFRLFVAAAQTLLLFIGLGLVLFGEGANHEQR